MKDYRVSVFNTITKKYEMVTVTKEVYQVYKKACWDTNNNDRSYRKHVDGQSDMSFGFEDHFENLDAYVDDCARRYEEAIEAKERHEAIEEAMRVLSTSDRNLIHALFYDGYSEKEYAEKLGISQPAIHKKKKRILQVLRKEMEKFL